MEELGELRKEYEQGELRRETLKQDPIEQFALWLDQACNSTIAQPNAMSLATVSRDGQPSLRTVLLKSYDRNGFVFFTNLESRKAIEISQNPRVALLFAWIALERQVIITGSAQRISTAEALKYFLTRPRGSQISAWVSPQSSIITSRGMLEMQWKKMSDKFKNGRIPLPSFWGGYRVKPQQIEFWQGRANRLHDRFMYTLQNDSSWTIEQLAP
jgi:pyridoxamine 5'-phosphate oxidase